MKKILMKILTIGVFIFFLSLALFIFLFWLGGRSGKTSPELKMSTFDPDKYYEENSRQVRISSDNDQDHRAFAVKIPNDYYVDKDLIYYGERNNANFYFYHDISFLVDMRAGLAQQLDVVKGELAPFGKFERNEVTIDGYIHQGIHFLEMRGLDYMFRCSYKLDYAQGADMCVRIIKSIVPITVSNERFQEDMQKINESLPTN